LDLLDVNVLLHAHREEQPEHEPIRRWLEERISEQRPFGVPSLVFSGFLRIATNPRAFRSPTPLETALEVVESIRSQPHCVAVEPGARHWPIFVDLCRRLRARANVVPDAYLAAMAIETDSDFVSTDRGFGGFPGLRWRHPVDP
jgi:toxin-antitoxin system PIN domain toxin